MKKIGKKLLSTLGLSVIAVLGVLCALSKYWPLNFLGIFLLVVAFVWLIGLTQEESSDPKKSRQ